MTGKQGWLRGFEMAWHLCGALAACDKNGTNLSDQDLRKLHDMMLTKLKIPVLTDEENDLMLEILEKKI